jgi:hypothetical protein
MADTPGGGEGWKWLIGVAGSVLAVAAFFGIHNVEQLKDLLNGTSTSTSTSTGDTGGTSRSSLASPTPRCFLYCNKVHFNNSGIQFAGRCGINSGCPVSGTFINEGTETGGASVTFYLKQKNSSGENEDGNVGTCSIPIPSAPRNGVVSAGCTIYPSAALSGTVGLTAFVNNPVG